MSKASLELGGGNWAAKDNGDGTGSLLGYAVGDTSGKYLPREFTFSRGADIGATRVNKDGLIEKYRENLLTYSNQFDSWTVVDATATSGQTGYDGTSDAWLFTTTVAGASLEKSITASGVVVFSMYAKKGTVDGIRLRIDAATDADAYFNLSNNSVHSFTGSAIDASITDLGGGWQRCKVYANISSPVKVAVYTTDGTTAYDNGNIYIQDAQFEYGLVATDYLESDDETGKAGVLDNLPRIDYTSGSAQLLLEPSRTNYFEQSEYIASNYWFKENATITQNDATSPEGVYNAVKLIDNSTEARHRFSQATSFTSGTDYTLSVFVKKNSSGRFLLLNANTAFNARAALNLDTLEVTNINGTKGKVEDYGNGWYRFSVSGQATSTASTSTYIQMQDSASDVNYVGDGSSFYLYGAQVEAGSYATSYIPTYGAQDTRNADTCTTTSSNLISSQLFSMFFEHTPTGGGFSGSTPAFELNIQGTSDNVSFYVNNSGIDDGLNIYLGPTNGGYIWGTGTNDGWTVNQKSKVALTYDGDNLRYFINGVLHNSQTGVSFTDADTSLYITHAKGNKVEQALVFPTALTDQEAIALTTL